MSRWNRGRRPRKAKETTSGPLLPPPGATISPEEYRRLSSGPVSPRTPRGRPEAELQRDMVRWLDSLERTNFIFTHPANERKDRMESIIATQIGQRSGVADLIFWISEGRTLAAEVKAPNGSLSANQRKFRDELRDLGHPWIEVRSINDLHDGMRGYGCRFDEPYPSRILRLGPDAFKKS